MATLLAFPLAQPLGGNKVSNLRATPLGGRSFRLNWDDAAPGGPYGYSIAIDGNHYANILHAPPIDIKIDPAVDGFSPSPIVEVVRIPKTSCDPGFHVAGYFSTPIANKIKFTWAPPADISRVNKYRVYWDKGGGTVYFTRAYRLGQQNEDGSSGYEMWTPALTSGTYKFVVRTVDAAGNESTNTSATSIAITCLPAAITGLAITYSNTTKKATLTWVDPAGIGSGKLRIFHNAGDATKLFPDYSAAADEVNPGVQSWTSPVLTGPGVWVFGIRAYDGTNQEPNTSITAIVRLDASANKIVGAPPKPFLVASAVAGGKIALQANVLAMSGLGVPTTCSFFTNDGAGGAVDYGIPITGSPLAVADIGQWFTAVLQSPAYGETARKFGCIAYAGAIPSVVADEVTITPVSTAPPDPLSQAAATGRV